MKRRRLAEEEVRAGAEAAFTAYGIPLAKVTSVRYLGSVLSADNNYCPAVVRNLWKARWMWARLMRVLSREGADAQASGQIYLAVVQSVLLYGSETWVMTAFIRRVLGGFHHRFSRSLICRQPWRGRYGMCIYPLMEDAMVEAGLQEVETYISHRQNTAAQFIAASPIMYLYLEEERGPGKRLSKR